MARFHFQVKDSAGGVRTGTMEARNLADARQIIENRGFSVVQLRAVEEAAPSSPKLEVHTKSAHMRHHVGPAPRREYRPPLGERLAALLPPASALNVGFLLLALLGALWMVRSWRSPGAGPPGSRPAVQATPESFPVKLLIEGKVNCPGSPGDVEILVDLPEIPYQQTFQWSKIKHVKPDHFVVEVQFESTRKAKTLRVVARQPGVGEASVGPIHLRPGGGDYRNLEFNIKR